MIVFLLQYEQMCVGMVFNVIRYCKFVEFQSLRIKSYDYYFLYFCQGKLCNRII